MKTAVVLAGALVSLVLAVSAAPAPSPPDATGAAAQMFTRPPTALWHFGYVRSLTKKGTRWELRFDPALWLSGVTANRAAVEDHVIRPGDGVPNDYYVRNDRPRALTFLVPPSAKATVLTNRTNIRSTRVPLAELAEIVLGRNPKRRALMDQGNHLGYWISVRLDTVRSLDQQYQP